VTTVSEVLGADVSPADLVPAIERVFRAEDVVVAA
jgi:lipoyl(octanoyl) transferase